MGAVARRLKKKKGLKRGLTVDRVVANPCKFFLKCVKTVSRSVESLSVDDRLLLLSLIVGPGSVRLITRLQAQATNSTATVP